MTSNRLFLLPAAVVSLSLIACASILGRSLVRVRSVQETIHVIGSARKPIRSDLIIWRGHVSQNAPTLAQGYTQLKQGVAVAQSYLKAQGVQPDEMTLLATGVRTLYIKVGNDTGDDDSQSSTGIFRKVAGYQLSQDIEVRSNRVELVERVSRQSTELISKGVDFDSQAPLYFYTKMSELKVSMQAEAARDAHARAEQIALSSSCTLGDLRSARMSAPNITPQYSTQESDGGTDDSSALDKKITAIVVADYAIRS